MNDVMEPVNRMTNLAGSNRLELLMFHLGGRQKFGINVFKLREIMQCPKLTIMPSAHHCVRGVAHLRGATVTIMDLAEAIGRPAIPMTPAPSMLVTEYNRQVQGFIVSGVERIVNCNWEDIKAPPIGLGKSNYLTAVTRVEDELVEIIDVEKVLGEVVQVGIDVSDSIPEAKEIAEGKHILVVDDSQMARKQITIVLDQLGIAYTTAANGKEAMDLLRKAQEKDKPITEEYSFVLSDVEMPEMDGYTLTKTIKEDPELNSLYVCLHTSLSGVFNQSMIEKVGADRLLSKFDPDELAQEILDILHTLEDN